MWKFDWTLLLIRAFNSWNQEDKFAAWKWVTAKENSNKIVQTNWFDRTSIVDHHCYDLVAIVWFALDPLHDGSLKIGDLVTLMI